VGEEEREGDARGKTHKSVLTKESPCQKKSQYAITGVLEGERPLLPAKGQEIEGKRESLKGDYLKARASMGRSSGAAIWQKSERFEG